MKIGKAFLEKCNNKKVFLGKKREKSKSEKRIRKNEVIKAKKGKSKRKKKT